MLWKTCDCFSPNLVMIGPRVRKNLEMVMEMAKSHSKQKSNQRRLLYPGGLSMLYDFKISGES